MNRKYLRFRLDETTDEGGIEGHLAVRSSVDLAGEVVDRGAFKRTLAASKGVMPILFLGASSQPYAYEPIGKWTEMREDAKGLYVKGRINLEVARGREVFALLKQSELKGLSIGYDVLRDEVRKGVRHLLELRLWEVSAMVLPRVVPTRPSAARRSNTRQTY